MAKPRETSIGRYELLIELGQGGMAELFLGRLHGAGGFAKLVAIKRILPHLARDREFTAMFLEEGRIASRLSHPNVCQVFELDQADDELFLAMEYLDGVGWDHLVAAVGADQKLALAAGVLAQAADGLHYAHTLRDIEGESTPVVHRDVSPQNLFVTVDGICKVLDFGVSKMMTDGPRTRSGVVKGKLPYMAPEQIRGEAVDARTDVFSLGVCLWEAFTGERLYDRSTDFLVWKAITEEDAPDVATRWPTCPPAVAALVRRALSRDPARRHATARELADDLRAMVPDYIAPARIGDIVRTACAERIATRAKQVTAAVSSNRSGPVASDRTTPASPMSAADTLQSGRSAAMTLDDKPARDPGETTDLRKPASGPMKLRDRSHVVARRDSAEVIDASLDHLEVASEKHRRTGLIVGGVVAAVVLGVVAFIVTRPTQPKVHAEPPKVSTIAADAATPPADIQASEPAVSADAALAPIDRDPPAPVPTIRKRPSPKVPPKPDPGPPSVPAPAEPASLSVNSEPYATIYVDNQRLGDTPLFRSRIAAGKHVIRAVRADGVEKIFAIDVAPGKEHNAGRLVW